jgi:hypothetical protein
LTLITLAISIASPDNVVLLDDIFILFVDVVVVVVVVVDVGIVVAVEVGIVVFGGGRG